MARTFLVPLAAALSFACGAAPESATENDVGSSSSALTLTLTSPTTYALASGAIPAGNTVSGGNGSYSCAITTNNSGGASCSVSGNVVSYTAGPNAGYYIKSQRMNDFFRLVAASGGPYLQTGGVIGSSAEIFKLTTSGAGWVFQAKSSGNYVRNGGTISVGNNLVADTNLAGAGIFTQQNCNGSAYPTAYNRFGYKSATGTNPYWQSKNPTVDAVNNGNGSPCDPTSTGSYEAFYLNIAPDTLTITDTAANSGTVTVNVENPIQFLPTFSLANTSSAMTPIQTWGGSGVFTGGSAGCSVITNNSGGGACTVTGYGLVSYTAGATTNRTDTIRVTDSEGHTGTFTVAVTPAFSVSASTSYAVRGASLGTTINVTGGSNSYSCAVASSTSGGTSCSVTGGVVTYTPGLIAGYNIRSQRTSDYLQLVTASGGPYVQTGGAVGSTAELFLIAAANNGTGVNFQANSTGNYLRNAGTISTGNNLVADVGLSGAAVYTQTNCNGTGNSSAGAPDAYNRFGFRSASGTSPYWQAKSPTVDAVNNGNGSACSTTNASPWEGFNLISGLDRLTITDSVGHSSSIDVTIENPITFLPASDTVAASTAVTTQAWGGSTVFTGGSAGCTVTSNGTGGGGCTLTSYGSLSHTVGTGTGTDIITVTDSQGHTGIYTVSVGVTLTQISASKNFFACARSSDGLARCWGENDDGQLGNNTTTDSAIPVPVSGLTGVTQVAANGNSACALLSGGTVKCWGDNTYGQLGDGTTTSRQAPSSAVSGVSSATAIGSGLHFSCALISGGTVKCWGDDTWGQLGDGVAGPGYPQSSTAVSVSGLTGATAISVGSFHACALVASGVIKCWGDGTTGQLGNGGSVKSWSAVTVSGITGATSVGAGESSTCAVMSDATAKCWGDQSYGALGDGVSTLNAFRTTPVTVNGLTSVASIVPGYPFACARHTNSSVSCWGRNAEGELGDTTSTANLVPTKVPGVSTATSLAVGGHFACTTLTSGIGECWGYNPNGALGNGTTTDSTKPVGVSFGCTTSSCGSSDLTVGSVTWTPTTFATGATVTFSATVWNHGTAATPAGTIHGIRFDIDGTMVNYHDAYTTSIPPGGSVVLSATGGFTGNGSVWPTTAGSHTLQAWVDDVNRISESNESNNTLSVNMSVGIDTTVTSISWSPVAPGSGTQTQFSAVVKNVGSVATPGGTILGVRFDIDGAAVNWKDNYTTALAPGASVTLTANSGPGALNYWTATAGSHSIQAWADDVARYNDVYRSNDKTTWTIVVP